MSKDWTTEELQRASAAMKRMGFMSYEEFEAALQKCVTDKAHNDMVQPQNGKEDESK